MEGTDILGNLYRGIFCFALIRDLDCLNASSKLLDLFSTRNHFQMNTLLVIEKTEEMLREKFAHESTGHDWHHIDRVRRMALLLATEEGADSQIVELGALLHDIDDWKFNGGDDKKGPEAAKDWLVSLGANENVVAQVVAIVEQVTFKGAKVATPTHSIEAAVVQDADRLDALGAIGIARAFAYGGANNRLLWDPEEEHQLHESFEEYKKNSGSTIAHFHEKLLLLQERMQTESGKQMAKERHSFMKTFLEQFENEWWGAS